MSYIKNIHNKIVATCDTDLAVGTQVEFGFDCIYNEKSLSGNSWLHRDISLVDKQNGVVTTDCWDLTDDEINKLPKSKLVNKKFLDYYGAEHVTPEFLIE